MKLAVRVCCVSGVKEDRLIVALHVDVQPVDDALGRVVAFRDKRLAALGWNADEHGVGVICCCFIGKI